MMHQVMGSFMHHCSSAKPCSEYSAVPGKKLQPASALHTLALFIDSGRSSDYGDAGGFRARFARRELPSFLLLSRQLRRRIIHLAPAVLLYFIAKSCSVILL